MLAFRGEAGGGGNDLKKIGHAKATAEVLQIFNELMGSNHQITNSKSMASQDFGSSINPILPRGTDSAHHIYYPPRPGAPPPGFSPSYGRGVARVSKIYH